MVFHSLSHVAERQFKLAKESREHEAKHFDDTPTKHRAQRGLSRQNATWSLTKKYMSAEKAYMMFDQQTLKLRRQSLMLSTKRGGGGGGKRSLQKSFAVRDLGALLDDSSSSEPQKEKIKEALKKSHQETEENNSVTAASSTSASYNEHEEELPVADGIEDFVLKNRLHGGSVGGMHWQEDPTGKTWLHNGLFWPRDNATVRGKVIEHKGKKWLLATQVKQFGKKRWHTAPRGAALPFFYGQRYRLVPIESVLPISSQLNNKPQTNVAKPDDSEQAISQNVFESSLEAEAPKDDVCLIFLGSKYQGILHIQQFNYRYKTHNWNPVHSTHSDTQSGKRMLRFLEEKQHRNNQPLHYYDRDTPACLELLMHFLDQTRSDDEHEHSAIAPTDQSSQNETESTPLFNQAEKMFPDATLIVGTMNGFRHWCEAQPPQQIMEVMECLDRALQDLCHDRRTLSLESAHSQTMVARITAPRESSNPYLRGAALAKSVVGPESNDGTS